MLAQQDTIFQETGQTIFQQNQDAQIRTWCEAVEEAERVARTTESLHKKELAKRDAAIAERDSAIAQQQERIAQLLSEIQQLKERSEP